MEQVLSYIIDHKDFLINILGAVGSVVLSAKAITILTPTKVDDDILAGLGKLINIVLSGLNLLALNILKDKNADAVAKDVVDAQKVQE